MGPVLAVRSQTVGGVATITINRPAERNALTCEMPARLADAVREADARPDVRAPGLVEPSPLAQRRPAAFAGEER